MEPAARPREDLPSVRFALANAPRNLVEVELEHLAQQEDRALGRRQQLQQHEKCRRQGRRQVGGFLIRFCQACRGAGVTKIVSDSS